MHLFPGTIAENIAAGKQDVTREEIVEAAIHANIHDFISKLPNGYDTLVGEKGGKISGGERQRISIARAVIKDAPILLLDEPTSALDTQAEALIQEAINRFGKDKTVLVVAHRLSTIKDADQILVLKEGKIVESGHHQKLMNFTDGIYSRLYNQQAMTDLEVV